MKKDFMPVHTEEFKQLICTIESSLGKAATACDDWISQTRIHRVNSELSGPICLVVNRCVADGFLTVLRTTIEIEIDHEVVLKTVIKSDHELDRVKQIIRCLNPNRYYSPVGVVRHEDSADGCFMEIPDGLVEELPFV